MQGKRIVLGVTGGIAAFKAAALCSKLTQSGARVRVVMTRSATEFVTPLTFQALSQHEVTTEVFDEPNPEVIAHIDLADHADLVVIAPATAHTIAKLAYGLADDMLSSLMLATRAEVLIAPAMNVHMYAHPTVQQNMATLKKRGYAFVEPGEGQLACGYVGKGRMAEPEEIIQAIATMFKRTRDLTGCRMLVTAGPTVEALDPVRFFSNRSSGKMGYAIAEQAAKRGADVVLVSGPTHLAPPADVTVVPVTSAEDMYREVRARFPDQDVVIKAAAVADYRPATYSEHKLKKQDGELTVKFARTPDILAELGRTKEGQLLVGFAAETNDVATHAQDKLKRKNLDLIVANDVSKPGVGFATDTNAVSIYNAGGLVTSLPVMSKAAIADALLDEVRDMLDG